ncbi:MAG TPA: hypothetical protein VHC92_02670 [Rhodanobacteraceae bacterium]|nr:hypothetical protein [Rhodanobacteraceae bacterium]
MIVQRALVRRSHSEASTALIWLVAIAGFAFDCAAYWPGQMSFDSAYTWWQARGGETTDIAPPVLIFLWRACDVVLEGPGLVFALHLALFWSGLALLADALRLGRARTIAFLLIAALAPVPWLLRGHVWTDVGLFSALLFATGALAKAQATHARAWIVAALPPMLYAAAIRHNALPALIPFAAWAAWLAVGVNAARTRIALGTALLFGAALLFAIAVDARVDRRVPLWPAAAEWDLAALSIASGEMLLPSFMIGPGLDVPELAEAFRDWSVVPMLQNTRHGMRDPFGVYTEEELSALRSAWLDAIRAHPRAWLAHHARRVVALLGVHDPEWPRELVYVDDEVRYRDNPPVARNDSALHRMLMQAAARLMRTPLLAGWPYLAVGLLAVPSVWRRRREDAGRIALVLLISAWLYLLPLLLLVPAELRYLGWCCLASVLAAELAWLVPASFRMRPDRISSTPRRTFR